MAFVHGKNIGVFINTVNCSAFLNAVDQSMSCEVSEATVFGQDSKSYIAGMKDATITLSGYWDGATDAIDDVMKRLQEGVNLLPPGDAVANYTGVQNVTNAVTPISGYAASIYFQDNGVDREVFKVPSDLVVNAVYRMKAVIQMDDGAAPVHYKDGVGFGDFLIDPFRFDSVNVSLIGGSIYQVSRDFSPSNAIYNNISVHRVFKNASYTSRGFRLAGLTLEATNLTNAISILDEGNTLGAKALVAAAKATSYQITNTVSDTVAVSAEFQVDGSGNAANSVTEQNLFAGANDIPASSYPFQSGVTNSPGGVSGFNESVAFADNAALRYATRSASLPASTFVTISCYIQMNDGSAPVIGKSSDASADAALIFNSGTVESNLTNAVVQNAYGSVYKISFSGVTIGTNVYHGILKSTSNSSKGFKVTAFEIFIPRLPTGAFRGQVLAPLAVRGNNSTSTALDNGVGTTNGIVFNIHMLNNAATTQVIIQHSPDGSTWADLFASYQTASIKFAQNGATVGPVNRYLRTLVTTSGSPQILITAARK